jgi:hypothetical protein
MNNANYDKKIKTKNDGDNRDKTKNKQQNTRTNKKYLIGSDSVIETKYSNRKSCPKNRCDDYVTEFNHLIDSF